MSKILVMHWELGGYRSSCRTVNSLQVGGVVDRSWLLVARVLECDWESWSWPDFPPSTIRPMNNCLRPAKIPWSAYRVGDVYQDTSIPDCNKDPMPWRPGSVIQTRKGIWRLLHDELAKGLGVPKTWLQDHYPSGRIVEDTVALHLLEGLSPLLIRSPNRISQTKMKSIAILMTHEKDSTVPGYLKCPTFNGVPRIYHWDHHGICSVLQI